MHSENLMLNSNSLFNHNFWKQKPFLIWVSLRKCDLTTAFFFCLFVLFYILMPICMRFFKQLIGNFYLPGFVTTRSNFSHGQNCLIEVTSIHVRGIRMLPEWWVQLIRYSNFCLENNFYIHFYSIFLRSSTELM